MNSHVKKSNLVSLRSSHLKMLVVLCFVFFGGQLQAQSFNIEPTIKDSISNSTCRYFVRGIGSFSAGQVLKVELLDENLPETLIVFNGSRDFSGNSSISIEGFTYDESTKQFQFEIGNFSIHNLTLHMWIEENGEMKNEIRYQ